MNKIIILIVYTVFTTAYAGVNDSLVAWYPFAGSLNNSVNSQSASLLDGAQIKSDSVSLNGNAVQIPAPFDTATMEYTASIMVYETGLTDTAGGAYLLAGEGGDAVTILSHVWVDRTEAPEGSYYVRADGNIGGVTDNTGGAGVLTTRLTAALIRNKWMHYVVVSSASGISVYTNGVLAGHVDGTPLAVFGNWFLGKHWWYTGGMSLVSSERIIGKMKNLKVFSKALSASDIEELYAQDTDSEQPSSEQPISVPQQSPYVIDSNTLLLEHFDGSTSGSQNGAVSYQNGVFGQGIHLDLGNWVSWNLGALSEATVEFWGKLDSFNPNGLENAFIQSDYSQFYASTMVVSVWTNLAMGSYHCGFVGRPGGDWVGVHMPEDTTENSKVIATNTWHHYAITWGSQGYHFYLDGFLLYSSTDTYAQNSATTWWAIGGPSNGGIAAPAGFSGVIDELRISNIQRTFSSSQTAWVSIAVSKVKVTQHVLTGRKYILESSADLKTWNQLGEQFTASSDSITQEFDVDTIGRFFRLQEVP